MRKIIAASVLLVILIIVFIITSRNEYSDKEFSTIEWNRTPGDRIKMVDDILKNKKFIGKDSTFILTNLGKSNEEIVDNKWKYLLDYKGILYPKYYFLTIQFNNSIVDTVYIEIIEEK
ncbi:hypothetical protein [Flavobacterium pedocola]